MKKKYKGDSSKRANIHILSSKRQSEMMGNDHQRKKKNPFNGIKI